MSCSASPRVSPCRRVISVALVLALLMQFITPAFAAPGDGSGGKTESPPGVASLHETADSPADSSDPLSSEDPTYVAPDADKTNAADTFIANQDLIVEEVLGMAIRLEDHIADMKMKLGVSKVNDMILKGNKDSLQVKDEVIGWAEPTTIDKIRVTRVVHADSGIAFLILPPEVNPDSRHLRQYIARTNLYAGDKGRHVLVLRLSSPQEDLIKYGVGEAKPNPDMIDKVTYHAMPETFKERLVAMKTAIWAGHPDKPMLMMAGIFAGAQALIAGSMSFAQNLIHHQGVVESLHNIDWRPAMLSVLFGMVVGSYSSTWKNFTNMPKSKFSRTARNSILSFAFAYSLKIWTDPHHLASLTIFDYAGLMAHASVWLNVVVNNITKDFWAEFSRIREEKGLSRGKVWNYFQRTNFEYQAINLGSYTLKMFDLVQFSVKVPLLGVVGIGKFIFLSSMVYMQRISVWYAEKLGYERAGELRKRWEDFKRARPLWNGVKKLYEGLVNVGKTAAEVCQRMLTSENPPPRPPRDGE